MANKYKMIRVKFKSIIFNGDDKVSSEYSNNGIIYHKDGLEIVKFNTDTIDFEFRYNDKHLEICQNQSSIVFELNQDVQNDYKTAYGVIPLVSRLDKLVYDNTKLQIVYELLSDENLLSKVYLQLYFSYL